MCACSMCAWPFRRIWRAWANSRCARSGCSSPPSCASGGPGSGTTHRCSTILPADPTRSLCCAISSCSAPPAGCSGRRSFTSMPVVFHPTLHSCLHRCDRCSAMPMGVRHWRSAQRHRTRRTDGCSVPGAMWSSPTASRICGAGWRNGSHGPESPWSSSSPACSFLPKVSGTCWKLSRCYAVRASMPGWS